MGGTQNKEDSDEVRGLLTTIHKLDTERHELLKLNVELAHALRHAVTTEYPDARSIALKLWDEWVLSNAKDSQPAATPRER